MKRQPTPSGSLLIGLIEGGKQGEREAIAMFNRERVCVTVVRNGTSRTTDPLRLRQMLRHFRGPVRVLRLSHTGTRMRRREGTLNDVQEWINNA